MNSLGGHSPQQSDFEPPQRAAMPLWVILAGGFTMLLMFTGLVVTTTLLIVQSNRADTARVIATQLDEPVYAQVEADDVTRQDVNILTPEAAAPQVTTPEVIAAVVPAAPAPAPAAPETKVASTSFTPVRLGAAHRYKVPSCVDYLDTLVKITSVRFEVGGDTAVDADLPRVRNIATALATCDEVKVIVEGHSDRRGSPDLNMKLSWFRAQSIIDQLQKEGYEITALQPRGFGAERPINLSGTISGEAENRRVQFALAPRAAAPNTAASDR